MTTKKAENIIDFIKWVYFGLSVAFILASVSIFLEYEYTWIYAVLNAGLCAFICGYVLPGILSDWKDSIRHHEATPKYIKRMKIKKK